MGNILYKTGLRSKYKNLTQDIIERIELNEFNKLILKQRYVHLMEQLDTKRTSTTFWYSFFTLMITLGSILVPALISIEDKPLAYPEKTTTTITELNGSIISNISVGDISQTNTLEDYLDKQSHALFWLTFCISLLVTICNAVIKLYSLDKIYIIRNLKYDELRREGWFFYTLTGDYKTFKNNDDAFKLFITKIETIKSMLLHDELTPEFNMNNIPQISDYVSDTDYYQNQNNKDNKNTHKTHTNRVEEETV